MTDCACEPAVAFRWPVRVYYEDTDAGGVVYHANYLRFMERARTEWLRARGFEQDLLRAREDRLFVLRRAQLQFVHPARFNDELSVLVVILGIGRASIDFQQTVLRPADGVVCCRGDLNIACVSASQLRPARIPDALLAEIRDGV